MRTIAVVALKGSQTKTTSTINMAACLAGQGRRVLVLDLDTQANTTYVLLRGEAPRRPTISEVLNGDVAADDAIVATGFAGVDLIPASADLADVNVAIGAEVGRERRLRSAMASISRPFDVCLIDTGPTRTLLTTNVLNAADEVLAPIVPGGVRLPRPRPAPGGHQPREEVPREQDAPPGRGLPRYDGANHGGPGLRGGVAGHARGSRALGDDPPVHPLRGSQRPPPVDLRARPGRPRVGRLHRPYVGGHEPWRTRRETG